MASEMTVSMREAGGESLTRDVTRLRIILGEVEYTITRTESDGLYLTKDSAHSVAVGKLRVLPQSPIGIEPE